MLGKIMHTIKWVWGLIVSLAKWFETLFDHRIHRFFAWIATAALIFVVWLGLGILFKHMLLWSEFWDDDSTRGAIAMEQDNMDAAFSSPNYVDQGWSANESLWFYNTSLGSNLLPYDFFMVLEQADKKTLFRDHDHINQYRYLLQKPTSSNPDGLPLGFVKDSYQGKEYLGFTCAACHTAQINYQGQAIRIDGGPSMADMEGLMNALGQALTKTLSDTSKRDRFVGAVLARNDQWFGFDNYDTAEEVLKDLRTFERRIRNYNAINHPGEAAYGFARLDAFGRIFNRIAEHVINKKTLQKILKEIGVEAKAWVEIEQSFNAEDIADAHLVDWAIKYFEEKGDNQSKGKLLEALFVDANAPVSYPHLWDAVQHDYVQWNGVINNSGLGGVGRNVGQILGVFATLDWLEKPGFAGLLRTLVGQQRSDGHYVSYRSSLDIPGLTNVEVQLKKLQSPRWQDTALPAIDHAKAKAGRAIYKEYCHQCHADIQRDNPDRRVIAHLSDIKNVQTDALMAKNALDQAYTGMVQGQYYQAGPSNIGKAYYGEKAPLAEILATVATNAVLTTDKDKIFFHRWMERARNIIKSYFENTIKDTIKQGDYSPDTSANPYASLLAYKARPLNGIWATAPFLHNGSVPTLYDLLLPSTCETTADGEMLPLATGADFRPDTFKVGSRQFDPVNVGFISKGQKGFSFDASKKGNSNCGHEYAAGRTRYPDGAYKPALDEDKRRQLLEYLKTL